MRPLIMLAFMLSFAGRAFAQDTSFSEFREAVEAADLSEKQRIADAFIAGVRAAGTPLFENDSLAVLLHQGEAHFTGDPTFWVEPRPFARVPGTDLFFLELALPKNARIEYLVTTEANAFGSPDPWNPHRVLSGFGPFSELAMPGYRHAAVFDEVRDGTPGGYERVIRHELPPGILPYPREVHVYIPPDYAVAAGPYPTLYLQDGRDYIEFAHAPRVLDHLIAEKRIEPIVAVFVSPPNRFQPDAPNRMTEYGLNDDYVAFLADELVPFIDSTYRTAPEPNVRLVAGDSFGGLISTYAAMRRPDAFGLAYSQSGYHSFQDDRLIALLAESPAHPIRFYVDVGLFERKVGAGWLPEDETDFLSANRRLRSVLLERGYEFEFHEYPEGHTWGNWRMHLMDALTHFFGRGRR